MLASEGDLIRAALRGERPAIDALVDLLTPVIQARAARLLLRRAGAGGRDVGRDVEDLTQEVFLSLFQDDGRLLRSWDAARGLSLQNFVGLIAHRQVVSLLRGGKVRPFAEDPTRDDELAALADAESPGEDLEARIASKEALEALLDQVRLSLSPRALELFHRMMVVDEPVERLRESLGMTPNALYTWRSRFAKLARTFLGVRPDGESVQDPAPGARSSRRAP